jgi:26S proteasome non-ATPase regulatory subunit 9
VKGLREGDIILEFGHICGENFKTLQDIAEVAKASVNLYLKVVVKRGDKVVRVNLKPQKWSGNGLIGCNIVPL